MTSFVDEVKWLHDHGNLRINNLFDTEDDDILWTSNDGIIYTSNKKEIALAVSEIISKVKYHLYTICTQI